MICMRCDESFNIKEQLRDHIRSQHARKSVNNSFLEIVAVNSVCEAMKKFTIVYSFILQASHTFTTSQEHIFEVAIFFESIILSECLNLSLATINFTCEAMKKSTITSSSKRIHESEIIFEFSSKNSHLKILSIKLICETIKRSIDSNSLAFLSTSFAKSSKQIFESANFFETIISSTSSNLSIAIINIASQSMKSASNQEATCVRMICKLCKRNFNFNNELYEHIRNHEVLKLVKNSHLSINAVDLICEIEKTSFALQKLFAKFQKSIFEFAIAFRTIILLKRSNLSFFTFEIKSESTKKSTTCRHCNQTFKSKKV